MKTALLHYWLTNVRGGEKVLAALGEMFPDADVFTHAYRPARMEGLFATHRVTESFIARLPLGRRVIAADCPGNRDVLKDYPKAVLFPVEDVDALADLLGGAK